MIQVKAPGKLYIAGEYAVTEPGYKSVLIALNRFVTATIEPSTQVEVRYTQRHYIMNRSLFIEMRTVLSFLILKQPNNLTM